MEIFLAPFLALILHGIPASIVILILYYFLKKRGHKKVAKKWRNYLFGVLGLYIVCVGVYDWVSTHHSNKFELDGKYKVCLYSAEIFSFMDWPIEYEIEITDVETGVAHEFTFNGEGPYLRFFISDTKKNVVFIKGYNSSTGFAWWIDMNDGTITQIGSLDPVVPDGFDLKVELTGEFEILNKQ